MAELADAQAEIGRLHDMFRQQGLEIDRLTALGNRPVNVIVEAISDILPDPFSGTLDSVDVEDFFKTFVSWLGLHKTRFHDNSTKLGAFKHCLNGQALIWWTNLIGAPNHLLQCQTYKQFFLQNIGIGKLDHN